MKNLPLLALLLLGCNPPTPPPDTTPAAAAEDSVALRAMLGAPLAVLPSEGPFAGDWYRQPDGETGLERLRSGHDTLGRYLINLGPANDPGTADAFMAYASGDSLRVFGNPDHHSPAMGLHLSPDRQQLVLRYSPGAGWPGAAAPMVRDTFWLDSLRVRR